MSRPHSSNSSRLHGSGHGAGHHIIEMRSSSESSRARSRSSARTSSSVRYPNPDIDQIPSIPGSSRASQVSLLDPRLQPGAPPYIDAPNDLKNIRKTCGGLFENIAIQFQACELTKAEKKLREQLYANIMTIRNLFSTVLEAQRDIANSIRTAIHAARDERLQFNVAGQIEKARGSIKFAREQLLVCVETLLQTSQSLKESASMSPGFARAVVYWINDRHIPQFLVGASVIGAISNATLNSHWRDQMSEHNPGTTLAQDIINGCMAVFATNGLMSFFGSNSPVYDPETRDKTLKAIECAHKLLEQFENAMIGVTLYWRDRFDRTLRDQRVDTDTRNLELLANLLDKHVDDCLSLANSAQRHTPAPWDKALPTPHQLSAERRHGNDGLPLIPRSDGQDQARVLKRRGRG